MPHGIHPPKERRGIDEENQRKIQIDSDDSRCPGYDDRLYVHHEGPELTLIAEIFDKLAEDGHKADQLRRFHGSSW